MRRRRRTCKTDREKHIKFDQILQRDLGNVLMQRHEIYGVFMSQFEQRSGVVVFALLEGERGEWRVATLVLLEAVETDLTGRNASLGSSI
jgi:hypothetical protein